MTLVNKRQIADGARAALIDWHARYETEDGQQILAQRPAEVKSTMIRNGWRNVSRLDNSDFRAAGFEIVKAMYVSGAHPTGKYCDVIVYHRISHQTLIHLDLADGKFRRHDPWGCVIGRLPQRYQGEA